MFAKIRSITELTLTPIYLCTQINISLKWSIQKTPFPGAVKIEITCYSLESMKTFQIPWRKF